MTNRDWLSWTPRAIAELLEPAPSTTFKTYKTIKNPSPGGFDGFVGSAPSGFSKSDTDWLGWKPNQGEVPRLLVTNDVRVPWLRQEQRQRAFPTVPRSEDPHDLAPIRFPVLTTNPLSQK